MEGNGGPKLENIGPPNQGAGGLIPEDFRPRKPQNWGAKKLGGGGQEIENFVRRGGDVVREGRGWWVCWMLVAANWLCGGMHIGCVGGYCPCTMSTHDRHN